MKREIMIRLQDQILRVFLYFSIRKPGISVIIIAYSKILGEALAEEAL